MYKKPDSKKVSLKLSENNTVRLIQLYKNEPCLYEVHSHDYKNRDLRAAAVKRIVAAFSVDGFGPEEVVTKFRNLRNSYSQELKKIEDSKKSATGNDDVYVPKVHWFDVMDSFLRPQMYTRTSKFDLVPEFKQARQTDHNVSSNTSQQSTPEPRVQPKTQELSESVSEDVNQPEDEKMNFTVVETVKEQVSTLHEEDEYGTSTSDQQTDRYHVIQSHVESHSPENHSSSAGDNFQRQRQTLRRRTVPLVSKLGWVKKKKFTSPKRAIPHRGTSQVSAITSAVNKLIEMSQLAVSVAAKNRDLYDNFGQFVAGVLRQAGGQKAIVMTNEITNVLTRHMVLPPTNALSATSSSPFTSCPQIPADRALLNHASNQRHKK